MATNTQHSPVLGRLPAALIVAGVLIGAAWLANNRPGGEVPLRPVSEGDEAIGVGPAIEPVGSRDHVRGRVDAPITFIEYGDLACEFCQAFHARVQRLLREYPEDVRWVWRHFPHDVNVQAFTKAEAAECAAEQRKFWEFVDAVFVVGTNVPMAQLAGVAQVVGLDVAQWEACVASGRHAERVLADVKEAERLGGKATPFSIMLSRDNHAQVLAGAVSYEQLVEGLQLWLARDGQ